MLTTSCVADKQLFSNVLTALVITIYTCKLHAICLAPGKNEWVGAGEPLWNFTFRGLTQHEVI